MTILHVISFYINFFTVTETFYEWNVFPRLKHNKIINHKVQNAYIAILWVLYGTLRHCITQSRDISKRGIFINKIINVMQKNKKINIYKIYKTW